MIQGALVRVEYEITSDNTTDILAFIRTSEDERKKVRIEEPFLPYFYTTRRPIKTGAIRNIEETDLNAIYMSSSQTVWKIETSTPPQVGRIREDFKPHLEADIIFPIRFMIDEGLKYGIEYDEETGEYRALDDIDIEPKRLYLDIEVPNQEAIDRIKRAPGEIAIIGTYLVPEKEEKYFVLNNLNLTIDNGNIELFSEEEELINSFIDYVNEVDPDQLIGKNLTGFDLPYLKYRSNRLDIDFDRISPMNRTRNRKRGFSVYGRDVLDWMNYYEKMKETELESPRMHDILEDELEWDPIDIEDFEQCWKNDPDRLLERNRHDVIGPAQIDEEMLIHKFFNELRKLVGCRYEQTKYFGTMGDIYSLRALYNTKYVAPSKGTFGEDFTFSGAAVLEVKPGRWEDIVVLDISSAYPSSILTYNISPETYILDETKKDQYPHIRMRGDTYFRTDIKGEIPQIIENLLERRNEKKRLMKESEGEKRDVYWAQQYALKQIANSVYGLWGSNYKRFFKYEIAESITQVIKELIEYEKEKLEEEGYIVVLGDTDSLAIQRKENTTDQLLQRVNEIVDEYMREKRGVKEHSIKMDLDKEYDSLIIKTKKLYAGKRKSSDKIEKKGIGSRRSDVAPIAKELQSKMLELMLDGEDKEIISSTLRETIDKIREGNVPFNEIGVPTRYKKDPSKYEPSDVRSKIYRKCKDYLDIEIERGDKPKRVICKGLGRIAGFRESDLGDLEIDYETMIDEYIKPKIVPFFELYGLSWSRDIEGQKTLSSYV